MKKKPTCKKGHPIVAMSFTAVVCCYGDVYKDEDGCVVMDAECDAEHEGVLGEEIYDWRETLSQGGRVFYCEDGACEPTVEEELVW